MISEKTGVNIDYLKNPRNEAANNELHVANQCFLDSGLIPKTLDSQLLDEITQIATKYSYRCDRSKINSKSYWTSANKP